VIAQYGGVYEMENQNGTKYFQKGTLKPLKKVKMIMRKENFHKRQS
jgi:hypothetical protein